MMRHEPQVVISVDGLVTEAVHQNLRQTGLSFELYAARVAEHYTSTLPELQQTSKLASGGDAFTDMRSNAKKLGRMLNLGGDLRIPAVLVPSFIAALDDPWRSDVATAICQLIAPSKFKSRARPVQPLEALSTLLKEQGEAAQCFLGIACDGLSNDSADALLNTRTQLLQSRDAEEQALALIDAELARRNILSVG